MWENYISACGTFAGLWQRLIQENTDGKDVVTDTNLIIEDTHIHGQHFIFNNFAPDMTNTIITNSRILVSEDTKNYYLGEHFSFYNFGSRAINITMTNTTIDHSVLFFTIQKNLFLHRPGQGLNFHDFAFNMIKFTITNATLKKHIWSSQEVFPFVTLSSGLQE